MQRSAAWSGICARTLGGLAFRPSARTSRTSPASASSSRLANMSQLIKGVKSLGSEYSVPNLLRIAPLLGKLLVNVKERFGRGHELDAELMVLKATRVRVFFRRPFAFPLAAMLTRSGGLAINVVLVCVSIGLCVIVCMRLCVCWPYYLGIFLSLNQFISLYPFHPFTTLPFDLCIYLSPLSLYISIYLCLCVGTCVCVQFGLCLCVDVCELVRMSRVCMCVSSFACLALCVCVCMCMYPCLFVVCGSLGADMSRKGPRPSPDPITHRLDLGRAEAVV